MQKYVVLVLLFISIFSQAQVASELSPTSLILPRLSTSQQSTLPPQQAGNVVFNADEKKLAVHDGNQWNYISGLTASQSSMYTNHKLYSQNTTFVVPAGITKILVEIWGDGGNGQILSSIGADVRCSGGGGGQYVQAMVSVNPVETLNLVFDEFSNSLTRGNTTLVSARNAGSSVGGDQTPNYDVNLIMIVSGQNGKSAEFSFQQANAGVYRKIVKTGAGGGTYPTFANGGNSITMEFDVNSGSFIGSSLGNLFEITGKFPGGGAGCSYVNFNVGASGAVILHY
ncbi:hypothetical protein [Lacihabitans soyangensis]|uniref:DUF4402 domain-containing protein n=1 Tax=Lacihabitans soyangensis TaxID=869394 RepID=A0AAE3KRH2_9BACT|nr:hypothetical protein [Lacihabitans soyangensis]MCP9762217.1 hypothetical protein [Lacihabitans soyangensis]